MACGGSSCCGLTVTFTAEPEAAAQPCEDCPIQHKRSDEQPRRQQQLNSSSMGIQMSNTVHNGLVVQAGKQNKGLAVPASDMPRSDTLFTAWVCCLQLQSLFYSVGIANCVMFK
jgi:hypothetical protein